MGWGGGSQNLILWEPLLWQGIPAGRWLPHPCHGHSRGPPPLDHHTHASLLPTVSEGSDPDRGSAWFLSCILAVCSSVCSVCRVDSEVTYSGGVCFHHCVTASQHGQKPSALSSVIWVRVTLWLSVFLTRWRRG